MNDHERERIAAAVNHLRPDWPKRQLLTLLEHPQLADRPRRDVTVALGWVACEAGTATPYRVLEAGPWWRAAAVEGATTNRDNPPKHLRCTICSLSRDRCRQIWADDHDFDPPADRKLAPEAIADVTAELRDLLQHTNPPVPARVHTPDPHGPAARARAVVADDSTDTQEEAS